MRLQLRDVDRAVHVLPVTQDTTRILLFVSNEVIGAFFSLPVMMEVVVGPRCFNATGSRFIGIAAGKENINHLFINAAKRNESRRDYFVGNNNKEEGF